MSRARVDADMEKELGQDHIQVHVKRLLLDCESISAMVVGGKFKQEANVRVELTRAKQQAPKKGGRGNKLSAASAAISGPRDVVECLGWRGVCSKAIADGASAASEGDDDDGHDAGGAKKTKSGFNGSHLLK